MDRYTVPAGTDCLIRKPGSEGWVQYRTTRDNVFTSYAAVDNGGRWLFTRPDGWELKVPSAKVVGRPSGSGDFERWKRWHGAKGVPTGRGASRRRRGKY